MKELEILKKSLSESGKILRNFYGKVNYSLKGRANLLTEADLASQRKAVGIIKAAFPRHEVLAEEEKAGGKAKIKDGADTWIIDPLDGTTNYAHTFPVFCVSIALVKNGSAVLGGIFDPVRDEMFTAARGKGAFLNSKKVKVSKTRKLSASLLATGFAYDRAKKSAFYCAFYSDFLKVSHDIRRSGSASVDMAWLACGRTDGYWEFNLKPWDVAAGKIIVEEAGGKVSDLSGGKWKCPTTWGKETLASNGKIHGEMIGIIRRRLRSD